jgi:hypothetical protein
MALDCPVENTLCHTAEDDWENLTEEEFAALGPFTGYFHKRRLARDVRFAIFPAPNDSYFPASFHSLPPFAGAPTSRQSVRVSLLNLRCLDLLRPHPHQHPLLDIRIGKTT